MLSKKVLREYGDIEYQHNNNRDFQRKYNILVNRLLKARHELSIAQANSKRSRENFNKLYNDSNMKRNAKYNRARNHPEGIWADFLLFKSEKDKMIQECKKKILCEEKQISAIIKTGLSQSVANGKKVDSVNTFCSLDDSTKRIRNLNDEICILQNQIGVKRMYAQANDPNYKRLEAIMRDDCNVTIEKLNKATAAELKLQKFEKHYKKVIEQYQKEAVPTAN